MSNSKVFNFGMQNGRRLILVGSLPPPVGGIAVHLDRLARDLARDYSVHVFSFSGIKLESGAFTVTGGSRLFVASKLLLYAIIGRCDIIHIHVSAFGRGVGIIHFLLRICRRPVIVSVHSGSFPGLYRAASPRRRTVIDGVLRRCAHVVAISDQIGDCIIRYCGIPAARVTTVLPFIPFKFERRNFQAGRIVVSGPATPLYEWKVLINAIQLVNCSFELHLVFYNQYDEPYFSEVMRLVARLPRCAVYRDLAQEEFQQLLNSSEVFIRPTLTDGDSLAVREALAIGVKVIASDSVRRPEGCLLFRTSCPEALALKIEEALMAPGVHAGCEVVNGASALRDIYRKVAG